MCRAIIGEQGDRIVPGWQITVINHGGLEQINRDVGRLIPSKSGVKDKLYT